MSIGCSPLSYFVTDIFPLVCLFSPGHKLGVNKKQSGRLEFNTEQDARWVGAEEMRGVGGWGGGLEPTPRDEGQKDRRLEKRARDHRVGMTGATERGEKRGER